MELRSEMTTTRYPYSKDEVSQFLATAEAIYGPNQAHGPLSYRREAGDGHLLIAFTFLESPRTPGAYREIPYAS